MFPEASGVNYEEAKRVYDRILREKVGKGYQIAEATANGNAAISIGLPATKEHSGHTPELLTPIEQPEALRLAQDVAWWFQQKFDGRIQNRTGTAAVAPASFYTFQNIEENVRHQL